MFEQAERDLRELDLAERFLVVSYWRYLALRRRIRIRARSGWRRLRWLPMRVKMQLVHFPVLFVSLLVCAWEPLCLDVLVLVPLGAYCLTITISAFLPRRRAVHWVRKWNAR